MSDPAPSTVSNVPEFTVSEISGAVKRTLEGAFSRVRVRGEITEFKRSTPGHLYFSLKDENAKISAIVWRSAVSKLGLVPENGVEVIATGRVTTYAERSSYQLIIDRIEYAGAGALLARIEMLRQRLAAEGLFGQERKRRIPLLPDVVGVITSPTGAVLHDIRTTVERRFPRTILLWPVPVQGEAAAERIATAIAGFDQLAPGGPISRPDILIVARGGGSLEDLMAFNDERVVRAAAACRIPIISAVGHETDHTLIDLVADRRAPTPTAAAELAVPSRADLAAVLLRDSHGLINGLTRILREQRLHLRQAASALPDLPFLIGTARQRLDDRAERLELALPNLLAARRAALIRLERAVPDAPALLRAARQTTQDRERRLLLALPALLAVRRHALARLHLDPTLRQSIAAHRSAAGSTLARLAPAMLQSGLREARTRLGAATARLEGASHQSILARGFALVTDRAGHPIARAAGVTASTRLRLHFADGTIDARPDAPTSKPQLTLPL